MPAPSSTAHKHSQAAPQRKTEEKRRSPSTRKPEAVLGGTWNTRGSLNFRGREGEGLGGPRERRREEEDPTAAVKPLLKGLDNHINKSKTTCEMREEEEEEEEEEEDSEWREREGIQIHKDRGFELLHLQAALHWRLKADSRK